MRLGLATDVHRAPEPGRRGRWNGPLDHDAALPRLRDALRWFGHAQVDAVLLLGDLTDDGDGASLDAVLDVVAAESRRAPVLLGGNHDGPLLHAIEGASAEPPAEVVLAPLRDAGDGRFAAELDGLAGTDGPLVVASHFPLVSRRPALAARELRYAGDLANIDDAVAALTARPAPTVVVCGHLHVDDAFASGHVLQLVTPPIVEGAGAAAVLDVEREGDDGALTVRREVRALDGYGGSTAAWRHEPTGWR